MLQLDITPKDIRHIVLISIDTCRADHLGCYDYSRKTSPNIDALAADGILFNHAVTPVPITLPAHSSMLTGMTPLIHGVRDNGSYRLDNASVTLAEILSKNGFVTGAIVGAFVLDSQFRLDQGFDTYDDRFSKGQKSNIFFYYNERKAENVTYAANAWLQKHRDEKFFLFLHYFDPHFPYETHKSFSFKTFPFYSPSTTDRYDGEVAYTDHQIGQFIQKLKDLGLYDSAMIILTADHGESLGEHSELSHAYFIYHSTVHVPLIIKAPGWPAGQKINNVVGLIDILPTVCGAVGIPVPLGTHGSDLRVLFDNNSIVAERYLFCESLYPTKFGLGPFLGLVSDRWKYIYTSEPELYDLTKDPRETRNLLDTETWQAHIMQEQLRLALKSSDLGTGNDNRVMVDEQTRKRLQSLGYASGRTVSENIQFAKDRPDAKKFVEVHNFIERFSQLKLTRKFGKAKRLCRDMLAKWPDMKQLYYYLGLIAVFEKDMRGIITYFPQYLESAKPDSQRGDMSINPKHELALAHGNLGAALQHEGQIRQAIPHYKKALLYNPHSVETNYNLAGAYLSQNRLSDAIKHYSRALESDPNFPQAHYMIGNALLRQEKFEEAIIRYNKALELKPDWQEARHNLQIAKARKKQTTKVKPR